MSNQECSVENKDVCSEHNKFMNDDISKKDEIKQRQGIRASTLAKTSLVVGLLSIITFGFLSVAGVVFGLVSLVQVNFSGGQLKGNRLALLGILLSLAPRAHTFILRLIFMR